MLYAGAYILFSYVYYKNGGTGDVKIGDHCSPYIYEALNWEEPENAGMCNESVCNESVCKMSPVLNKDKDLSSKLIHVRLGKLSSILFFVGTPLVHLTFYGLSLGKLS